MDFIADISNSLRSGGKNIRIENDETAYGSIGVESHIKKTP
jgi:hypothetical protein